MKNIITFVILVLVTSCVSSANLVSKHQKITPAKEGLKSVGLFGLSYERTRLTGLTSSSTSYSGKSNKENFSSHSEGVNVEYVKDKKTYTDISKVLEDMGIAQKVLVEKSQNVDLKFKHSFKYVPSFLFIGRWILVFTGIGIPIAPFLIDKGIITYHSNLRVYKDKKFIKEYKGSSQVEWKDNYLLHPQGTNIGSTTRTIWEDIDPNNPYQIQKSYSLGLYWASYDAISKLIKDKKTYNFLTK